MSRPPLLGWAFTLTIAALMTLAALPLHGQEHEGAAEGAEHEFHKNHVSVMLGGTTEASEGERSTAFSVGLDYERRFSRVIGLSIGAEAVFDPTEREALAGLSLDVHATRGLVLQVGPGVEIAKELGGEEVGAESEGEGSSTHAAAALRVGGLYQFRAGSKVTIAPAFYVDMVDGRKPVYVWGLSTGLGF